MGEAQTRADVRADAAASRATKTPSTTRDWRALGLRVLPLVGMVLAALLWWPTGFGGRAPWMHLPFSLNSGGAGPRPGDAVFLGVLVAAALVSALVASAWPRFGIAAGLTAIAWVLSEGDVTFAAGERPVLAALAGLAMLIGLAVGSRARHGVVAAAAFLALVAGLSPAMWSRGLLLAVAVALPFWAATADRVAPTVLAVVRVVTTWLVAVVISVSLQAGFAKVPPGGLAKPSEAAKTVGSGFVESVRHRGLEVAEAAARTYTSWIWLAVALAIALVVAAQILKRQRTKAS
ncbi:MAG: hypothetical protein ABIP45_00860 [Knoellia sp.]